MQESTLAHRKCNRKRMCRSTDDQNTFQAEQENKSCWSLSKQNEGKDGILQQTSEGVFLYKFFVISL